MTIAAIKGSLPSHASNKSPAPATELMTSHCTPYVSMIRDKDHDAYPDRIYAIQDDNQLAAPKAKGIPGDDHTAHSKCRPKV